MDIVDLAQEFDIHPDVLATNLGHATRMLQVSRENIRPADKQALRGVAKALEKSIGRISPATVRERLVEAVFEKPDGPDEDGLANYTAWFTAGARVDRALEGAQDLLRLVRAGEEFKVMAGRPRYDHWTLAIDSLLDFWTRELRREATISGHANDPRGVKSSRLVRFVHQCMLLIGEEITEQACRTILQNLRAHDGPLAQVLDLPNW